jgi:hypothetical protein
VFPAQFLDSIRSLNAFVGGEEHAMTFHDVPAGAPTPAPTTEPEPEPEQVDTDR